MLGYLIHVHALQQHMTNLGVKCRPHARGLSSSPLNSDCWRHQAKNICQNRLTYLTMQSAPIHVNSGQQDDDNDDMQQDGNGLLFSTSCNNKSGTNASHATSATSHNVSLSYAHKRTKSKIKVAVSTLFLFAVCSALVACSGQGAWRYYLAGGICAAISHAVTTPVDVIKVGFRNVLNLYFWCCK